jgi:DnaJ-domain-containing protein 1
MELELLIVSVVAGFIGYKLVSFLIERIFRKDVPNFHEDKGPFDTGGERSDSSQEDCWHILGVSPDVSAEDLQYAYRALIRKYHPDKVETLGDEFKEIAKIKTQQINAALDEAKRLRGFR